MFNLIAEANQYQKYTITTHLESTNVYNPVKVVCEREFLHAVLFCINVLSSHSDGKGKARLDSASPVPLCFVWDPRSVFNLKMRVWGEDKTEFPAPRTSKAGTWDGGKDLKQSISKAYESIQMTSNDIRLLVHSWFSGKLSEIWCCFCASWQRPNKPLMTDHISNSSPHDGK